MMVNVTFMRHRSTLLLWGFSAAMMFGGVEIGNAASCAAPSVHTSREIAKHGSRVVLRGDAWVVGCGPEGGCSSGKKPEPIEDITLELRGPTPRRGDPVEKATERVRLDIVDANENGTFTFEMRAPNEPGSYYVTASSDVDSSDPVEVYVPPDR